MEKIKILLTVHKVTVILIAVIAALLLGGVNTFQKFNASKSTQVQEVDLAFDAEGPYALLHPRRDGNALVLNLKRTASYDSISYELAYTSKTEEVKVVGFKVDDSESGGSGSLGVIDRGVQGTIDTKDKKGEYEQEILFGSCSKNVCKYDKGVENGTLTLHIKKGKTVFRMVTLWHLQRPDVALGVLTSGDGHLVYKISAEREKLAVSGFTIINDLTGVPKLPQGKAVLGKVYAVNASVAKKLEGGDVTLELAENPPADAKLVRYDEGEGKWIEPDTKADGSKLFSKAQSGGIFAVLTSEK